MKLKGCHNLDAGRLLATSMRKNILILAVFGVLVIAPAESAIASTATAVDGNLRYTAASGEANDVGFARVATNTYRVTDTGTVIVAGTGCTQESPNVVKCTMASRKVIIASLGDQNDNATAAATRTTQIFGEDGNDRLIGSNARDTLDGGNGDDAITGGGGNDRLTGGPGNDQITGDAGRDGLAGGDGNDLLDGGADADSEGGGNGDDVLREGDAANGADTLAGNGGSDTVDYAGRHDAVSVRVDDVADDGDTSTSEHDNVRTSIERVNGGSGSDVLVGRDGKPDTLVGGPGDDVLDPRRGNDQVDGGPGIDQIRVRDLSVDNVTCGDEVDSVAADSRDLTGTDCENVRRDASMSISVVGSARYPSIALRLACP
ncbi:MAG: hypothetical protein QOJ29_4340, partial [Thermoleophilaceae bacterium]|nr:hypothetical protein [Thermoleophilaceae bacterium]